MGKTKENKEYKMWDLLIPILLVICVMPFVVRLAIYSCGYSQYEWYSSEDLISDFYCYYKSYFLDVVAFFAAVILIFRMVLYRERIKPMKCMIPMLLYGGFVVLSTIFSMNTKASIQGNFESFESCFVLLSYIVILIYTYQIVESEYDYQIVWRGILVMSLIFVVVGGFQVFRHDLLNFPVVQRLVMSAENYQMYAGELEDTFLGSRVYLTLYNPNYAGIVLSMLFAVVLTMFVTERKSKKKWCYGVLCIIFAVLVWFTYSRASLLTLILIVIFVGLGFGGKHVRQTGEKRKVPYFLLAVLAVAVVLVLVDGAMGFRFISRIAEKNTREPLEYMTTDETGIHIGFDGVSYLLYEQEEQVFCQNESTNELISAEGDSELALPIPGSSVLYTQQWGSKSLILYIAETTLMFECQDEGYFYCNPNGTLSQMVQVDAVDFHGLEYLGSARGYIWSRVIPLLKKYILVGSGPDTFAEVFPQNDYAGKAVYSDNPNMIIEKGHNDFLTKWVQTGMLSVICIVVFYGVFIIKGIQVYGKKGVLAKGENPGMGYRLGAGCFLACISYMIAGLFNDSSLHTAPVFWVFAGIALSSVTVSKDKGI